MRKAFSEKKETKIILATNIAESSVTIPHCSHIIDFCLTKELKYDAKSGRFKAIILRHRKTAA
jgi:HrpA-like RNA helicase